MASSPPRPSQLDLREQSQTTVQVLQEALSDAVVASPHSPTAVRGRSGPPWSAGSSGPRGGGPGRRVCVCWQGGPPRGRRSAGASPSPGAHGLSPSPEAARAAAVQPRLRLPRFLPPALPRPGSRGCRRATPGGRAAQSAHGGGRRRPGSGRQCRREARAETPAPLSTFPRSLPASRTPLSPTPSRRD